MWSLWKFQMVGMVACSNTSCLLKLKLKRMKYNLREEATRKLKMLTLMVQVKANPSKYRSRR